MRVFVLVSVLALFSFGLFSCKKDNPVPPDQQPQISLSLEDVSCTEAWIKLTTSNVSLPADVELLKDDIHSETIILTSADTILYVDSLLPNKTYNLSSIIQSSNQPIKSNDLSITTLDTTSHNFTFQTWTFGGDAGSCTLYDVAIINENDIWAVGEIYLLDTLGQPDPNAYNALHWNGLGWDLRRIKTNACGGVEYPPIKAIFAFAANDILFAHIDGSISHYDGMKFVNDCTLITQLNGSSNKIWGVDSNDFYVVSGNGFIAHYQYGHWSRIESGTDVDLKDIYGSSNGNELWTCGWSNQNGRVAVLKINEGGVESIWDSQTNREFSYYYGGQLLNTLWANENAEFVFATGVVTRHSLLNKKILRYEWVPYLNGQKVLDLGNYAYRIRGSNKNNIFIVGDESMIWHSNGTTWHKFEEVQNFDDRLYGLAVTENMMVTVGISYDNSLGGALILMGKR